MFTKYVEKDLHFPWSRTSICAGNPATYGHVYVTLFYFFSEKGDGFFMCLVQDNFTKKYQHFHGKDGNGFPRGNENSIAAENSTPTPHWPHAPCYFISSPVSNSTQKPYFVCHSKLQNPLLRLPQPALAVWRREKRERSPEKKEGRGYSAVFRFLSLSPPSLSHGLYLH